MLFFKKRIYADAAAATPLSLGARKELLRLLNIYGNAGSLHLEGVLAKGELEHARMTIASVLGAHTNEIVFTASGTEGNNLALYGVLQPLLMEHKELYALTLAIEHQSVLEPLLALKQRGLSVTILPVDQEGLILPQALQEAVGEKTALVSIQLMNNEIGTLQPLREIAKELRHIAKKRVLDGNLLPLYFHCDASQAPLWASLQVSALGVDLMTLDAQKILGPKGMGALFIKRGTHIVPLVSGAGQEGGLRGGTPNVPLAGSFAYALQDAQSDVASRCREVAAIRDFLFQEIQRLIPEVVLNGPALHHRAPNNLNISVPGLDGETAVIAMNAEGIAISTRSACSMGDQGVSHVLKALHAPEHILKTAVRITLLPTVTRADAKRIAHALVSVVHRYKTVL